MAESGAPLPQVLDPRESTEGRWAVVVVVLVVASYVAGWRSRRRWGRLMGW